MRFNGGYNTGEQSTKQTMSEGSTGLRDRMAAKPRARTELGDFQTPPSLANEVCDLLVRLDVSPASVIEPTCGIGTFLRASEAAFPDCALLLGFEINPDHVESALGGVKRAKVRQANFFAENWPKTLSEIEEPILLVGNPPWVTNSALGSINGTNLPIKSNAKRLSGLDAITGKSNFDISEWMLTHLLGALADTTARACLVAHRLPRRCAKQQGDCLANSAATVRLTLGLYFRKRDQQVCIEHHSHVMQLVTRAEPIPVSGDICPKSQSGDVTEHVLIR